MEGWKIALIAVFGALFVIGFVIGIWIGASYNRFVKLRNQIKESQSNLDVYYKKRYDLIPNLVETVKGYAMHEKVTLENVIKARNLAMNSTGATKVQNENALSGTLKTLFSLTESYPELKADAQFLSFSKSLVKLEEDVMNARKYSNAVALEYNTLCERFPSNLVAKLFKFQKTDMFAVEQAEERKSVQVKF